MQKNISFTHGEIMLGIPGDSTVVSLNLWLNISAGSFNKFLVFPSEASSSAPPGVDVQEAPQAQVVLSF